MTRTLAEAAADAAGCTRCGLAEGRTQVVFGVGNPHAAGQLLTRMLGEIGLHREDVYIGNILKCRPPGNRDPLPAEIETCTPWLVEQITLIQPRLLVTLGNFATKFVLQTQRGITSMRGRTYEWHGRTVIPTFHPAAILHGGGEKSRQFQDLQADFALIRSTLDSPVVVPEAPDALAVEPPAEPEQQLELF
jgi:uracil-DNA glycosylase family 4